VPVEWKPDGGTAAGNGREIWLATVLLSFNTKGGEHLFIGEFMNKFEKFCDCVEPVFELFGNSFNPEINGFFSATVEFETFFI